MSAILKFLGGVFLVAIIGGTGAAAEGWHKARSMERDGAYYVQTTVPQIVANWNADEVLKRAAPVFKTPSIREGLPQVFQTFSQLGALRSLGKPKGVVTFADYRLSVGDHDMPMPPRLLKPVWARYTVDATFDAGSATVMMDLLWRDDRWQIIGFYIKPA